MGAVKEEKIKMIRLLSSIIKEFSELYHFTPFFQQEFKNFDGLEVTLKYVSDAFLFLINIAIKEKKIIYTIKICSDKTEEGLQTGDRFCDNNGIELKQLLKHCFEFIHGEGKEKAQELVNKKAQQILIKTLVDNKKELFCNLKPYIRKDALILPIQHLSEETLEKINQDLSKFLPK